jgi:uncharacterized protein
MAEPFHVELSADQRVTALLYHAAAPGTSSVTPGGGRLGVTMMTPARGRLGVTLILGHGAGANQLSGFMVMFASGLAARGLDVVTFNFSYTELRGRGPDPPEKLEACYRAVVASARRQGDLGSQSLVVGGKSLGGRIASHIAAAWSLESGDPPSALVFLGYPLHPPGRPERLRTEHLARIRAPMLFVQGSRDSFGTPEEVRLATAPLSAPVQIDVVEGGDHSFTVPKKWPQAQEAVLEGIQDRVAEWIARVIR